MRTATDTAALSCRGPSKVFGAASAYEHSVLLDVSVKTFLDCRLFARVDDVISARIPSAAIVLSAFGYWGEDVLLKLTMFCLFF